MRPLTRRAFVGAMSAASLAAETSALIAITLDLEMSMHYPVWGQTEWNYRKGDLDEASKRYTVDVARRVKEAGGVVHNFVVGRVFEQENVDWLAGLLKDGHHLGNHSYDHIHLRETSLDKMQYRFQRAPWLIEGKEPAQVIRENIRLTESAMKSRLGERPEGFRAPGGFPDGIADRMDLQLMLMSLGYVWVSTRYPAHPLTKPGEAPTEAIFRGIVEAQKRAQPFVYHSGLIEVPASPITDVVAFRTCRWNLEQYQRAIRESLEWAIAQGAVLISPRIRRSWAWWTRSSGRST
ncbi:MAG: polysaccharide deacetylase family protein [Bryobacteraceae bacterium]